MKNLRLIKLRSGDDAEIAATFKSLFDEAQNGLRRVVSFGLFAWEVKLDKLKHGQFLPWLAQQLPDVSARSVNAHMQLSRSVIEACGVQIRSALRICHSGKILSLPDAQLPDPSKKLREKICSIIDGKSARQLFAEFKQAEETDGEAAKPKRGRLKGQGGASREQRKAAQDREESARIEQIEIHSAETADWLLEVSDDRHLGLIPPEARAKLLVSLETAAAYLRRLR